LDGQRESLLHVDIPAMRTTTTRTAKRTAAEAIAPPERLSAGLYVPKRSSTAPQLAPQSAPASHCRRL